MTTFLGSWTGTESDQAREKDRWPHPAGLTIHSGLGPGGEENGLLTRKESPKPLPSEDDLQGEIRGAKFVT